MGSLWVKYDADGRLRGLSGGAGFTVVGKSFVDPANTYIAPAYTLVRAMASWRFPVGPTHVTAQVNVDNLLDAKYIYGTSFFPGRFAGSYGAPRSVLGLCASSSDPMGGETNPLQATTLRPASAPSTTTFACVGTRRESGSTRSIRIFGREATLRTRRMKDGSRRSTTSPARIPANLPWARLAPNPLLCDWLALRPGLLGGAALDVGCSLGDNAEALAEAGAKVTAFDFVARAIDWARRRFPRSAVDYRVADLFLPPAEWRGAFALVHECHTLQAISPDLLPLAAQKLASFVAPAASFS